MKIKRVLKFYFTADGVLGAMDRQILRRALCRDCAKIADFYVGRVIDLIGKKRAVELLWQEFDRALNNFTDCEREVLKNYAFNVSNPDKRQQHALLVRFSRRLTGVYERNKEGIEALKEYCIFIDGAPP